MISVKECYTLSMAHFGEWLRSARTESGLSLRRLEKLINGACTYSYLSQMENGEVGKKGQYYRPDRSIVDAIAMALNKPVDEARIAAGYAPRDAVAKPTTIAELHAALERLGLPIPLLHGGFPLDADGEGYSEILARIRLDFEMVLSRLHKGTKIRYAETDISEADVENDEQAGLLRSKRG